MGIIFVLIAIYCIDVMNLFALPFLLIFVCGLPVGRLQHPLAGIPGPAAGGARTAAGGSDSRVLRVGRAPTPARDPLVAPWPTRASAADLGVRPTIRGINLISVHRMA